MPNTYIYRNIFIVFSSFCSSVQRVYVGSIIDSIMLPVCSVSIFLCCGAAFTTVLNEVPKQEMKKSFEIIGSHCERCVDVAYFV